VLQAETLVLEAGGDREAVRDEFRDILEVPATQGFSLPFASTVASVHGSLSPRLGATCNVQKRRDSRVPRALYVVGQVRHRVPVRWETGTVRR
jgi:hypothetical protein